MHRVRPERWLGVALLLAACAHKPSGAEQEISASRETMDLPVRWVCEVPIVEATIGDSRPLRLALDSGCSFLSLSSKAVARVSKEIGELQVEKTEWSAITLGGQRLRLTERVTLPSMNLGAVCGGEVRAWIAPMDWLESAWGTRVDGILTPTMFGGVIFTIDYPGRRVRIARGSLPTPDGSSVFAHYGGVPTLPIRIGDSTQVAIVDSGYNGFLSLPESLRPVLRFRRDPRPTRLFVTAGGLRVVASKGRLLQDVQVGRFAAPKPIVSLSSGSDFVLGTEFLRHFRVSFDASNRRVLLEREGDGPIHCESVRVTGTGLAKTEHGWTVVCIVPGLPAEETGLREGDIVETIQGRPADEVSLEDRRALLREQDFIHLTIRRGTRTLPIRLPVIVAVE